MEIMVEPTEEEILAMSPQELWGAGYCPRCRVKLEPLADGVHCPECGTVGWLASPF